MRRSICGSSLAIEGGSPVRAAGDFLVFGAPHFEDAEIEEVLGCLRRRWIGTGPLVARFEEDFVAFKNGGVAVAVNSCTAALHLSMLASGLATGDEVIVPTLTFCATVNAVLHAGATPVLADCDPLTLNLDLADVESRITPRTRAILLVHFAGLPCDMDPLLEIAREHDLLVIEDCAHAVEAEYHGRPTGRFGDFGCFSFYVTKNVVTGEGGMILTADDEGARRIRSLALHGMSQDAWRRYSDSGYRHYEVIGAGYKYNMMDLQAALGVHQLARVDANWRRRREIWARYQECLSDLPCRLPSEPPPDVRHAYHLYTPLVDLEALGRPRDWVLDALTAEGIGVGVHYVPVHLHPFYAKTLGVLPGSLPGAEWVGERTFSLPLSPGLENRDVDDVCEAVRRVLGRA